MGPHAGTECNPTSLGRSPRQLFSSWALFQSSKRWTRSGGRNHFWEIDGMSSNVFQCVLQTRRRVHDDVRWYPSVWGPKRKNLNLELLCGSVLERWHRFPTCKHFCERPPQSGPLVRDEIYYIKTASSICWHRWIPEMRRHHCISKRLQWHWLQDFKGWGSNAWPTPPYFTHPMEMPRCEFASQSNVGNWTS